MVKNVRKSWTNYKWATSVWVSTSSWESLPIADQQSFFFVFLHEHYISLSYAWWKRYFFHDFWMFFIIFDACVRWSKYTTSLNNVILRPIIFALGAFCFYFFKCGSIFCPMHLKVDSYKLPKPVVFNNLLTSMSGKSLGHVRKSLLWKLLYLA